MARQELLDYLLSRSNEYEYAKVISLTGGGGDFEPLFSPVCERPLFHSGYDVFGVHWSKAKPTSHYTQGQPSIITNIENWRNELRIPVVDRFDWEYVAKQAQKLDRVNRVSVVTLAVGPFERTTALSSFEDCLVNAISEPDDFADLISALADYKRQIIDHLYRVAKPDLINLHDDWGTSTSTFFNPDLWRQIIKPSTKRLYDAIHERGMIVGQHSCGCITPLLDDVVEIGCDVWEAQANINDVQTLAAKYAGNLRILAPPPADGEELGTSDDEDKAGPTIGELPMNYRPYANKPTHLWV